MTTGMDWRTEEEARKIARAEVGCLAYLLIFTFGLTVLALQVIGGRSAERCAARAMVAVWIAPAKVACVKVLQGPEVP
jgi:hypothetical protein